MTDMTQRLAALPAERRAQFLAQLRAQAEDAAGQGPTPRGHTGPAPLSHAQETLWFLDRLAPDSSTYNVPWCTRLRGDLDVSALRSALVAVVARHEALRTAIVEREDGPVQVVAPEVPVELPLIEVAGNDHEQRLAAARGLVDERVKAPFNLSRMPLWRAVLIQVAPDDHLLLFDAHHIAFDARSLSVLTGELAEVYRSLRETMQELCRLAQDANAQHGLQIVCGAKDRSCVMRSGFVSFGVGWQQPIFNNVGRDPYGDCYLRAAEFSGAILLPDERAWVIETPRVLREHRFGVEVAHDRSLVWVENGMKEHIHPANLADRLMRLFLDLISRANKGKVERPGL